MEGTKKEKIQSIIIAILSLIILIGGAYFASELKYCNAPAEKEIELEQIGMIEFTTLLKNDESSIIYIARPTCAYCQQQEPIVKEILATYPDLPIFYLNTDEIEDLSPLFAVDTKLFGKDGEEFGTPTTLVVKNGKIVDSLVGLTQKDSYIEFLQKNEFIK